MSDAPARVRERSRRQLFRLPRLRPRKPEPETETAVEAVLGCETVPGTNGAAVPARVFVSCIDYCPEQVQSVDILDVDDFLEQHRPAWSQVRWINVDGLTDLRVIHALARKYELHPLAIEDMLHPGTRSKVEAYPGDPGCGSRLFIIARMIYFLEQHLHCEQLCFFLGKTTILTFQQTRGDVWDEVRARIHKANSRIRKNDVSFLLYALIDAVVDQCFPVMEHYSDRLEEVEAQVLNRPDPAVIGRIHQLKHELMVLRREFWPMREMLHALQRIDDPNFSPTASLFLRDVYDHSVQVIDLMETYREFAISLTETYMNAMSFRMNEVMKVLTILSTIFMPLSFLTGVFGMNFPTMPEFQTPWTFPWLYPIGFYALCISVVGGMFVWFKKRGWV